MTTPLEAGARERARNFIAWLDEEMPPEKVAAEVEEQWRFHVPEMERELAAFLDAAEAAGQGKEHRPTVENAVRAMHGESLDRLTHFNNLPTDKRVRLYTQYRAALAALRGMAE